MRTPVAVRNLGVNSPSLAQGQPKSKAKRCLQIKAAVRRTRGERTSLQRVGSVEKWRAENPAWIRQIYIIENIADGNTQDEVVAPV